MHRLEGGSLRRSRRSEVVQEIYGWLLGHWSVRVVMFQAATNSGVPLLLCFEVKIGLLGQDISRFHLIGE